MSTFEQPRIEPLGIDNYSTWKVRMRLILVSKGLWGAVTKDEKEVDEVQSEQALALIGLAVQDFHLTTVGQCKTAKELWELLEKTFQAKTNARRLQLRKDLLFIRKGSTESITVYVSRAKAIQDDLVACGQQLQPFEVASSVLNGLPEEYQVVCSILASSAEELSVDRILPALLQEEQRLGTKEEEVAAYAAQSSVHRQQMWH